MLTLSLEPRGIDESCEHDQHRVLARLANAVNCRHKMCNHLANFGHKTHSVLHDKERPVLFDALAPQSDVRINAALLAHLQLHVI